jgi:hypothetical protein
MRFPARMFLLLLAVPVLAMSLAGCGGPAGSEPESASLSAVGACEDVTSYDDNWDNDMKCRRSDGSIFYTDYEGAERFERNVDGSPSAVGTCEDVTTYDYNWDNDMKCTRSDGSTFYTDYAGAERFERNGDK